MIPNIAILMIHMFRKPADTEIIRFAGRIEGVTHDLCTQLLQPDAEPGTLEARMSCDKNPLALINVLEHDFSQALFIAKHLLSSGVSVTARSLRVKVFPQ